ncbi:MAG: hypothetical protein RIQ91_1631, partial [Bacteroidota bacterium]
WISPDLEVAKFFEADIFRPLMYRLSFLITAMSSASGENSVAWASSD